ncbi:MAG: hypothetical protein ACREQC_08805 [Candidatus Binataceae bacterium]
MAAVADFMVVAEASMVADIPAAATLAEEATSPVVAIIRARIAAADLSALLALAAAIMAIRVVTPGITLSTMQGIPME